MYRTVCIDDWRVNTVHLTMCVTFEQLEDLCWLLSRTSHKHKKWNTPKENSGSWRNPDDCQIRKVTRVFFSLKSLLNWDMISVMKIYLKIASKFISQTISRVEIVSRCAQKEVVHTCGSTSLKVLNKENVLTKISDISQLQAAEELFFFSLRTFGIEKYT